MNLNVRLLGCLLPLLLAGTARADSVFTAANFSASGPTAFDQMGLDPFDPGKGTLDSVHVQIQGQMTVSGTAIGIGEMYEVEQEFFGLGRFFEFNSPARFIGTASGSVAPDGTPIPVEFHHLFTFNYSFAFTEVTDLFGGSIAIGSPGTGIIPPTSISAYRSDFLPWAPGLYELDMVANVHSGPAQTTSAGGAVIIEYRYTPPAPVPTPAAATGALFLFGLVATRRRTCGSV